MAVKPQTAMLTIKIVIVDEDGLSRGSTFGDAHEAAAYVRMQTQHTGTLEEYVPAETEVGAVEGEHTVIPTRKRNLWEILIGKRI